MEDPRRLATSLLPFCPLATCVSSVAVTAGPPGASGTALRVSFLALFFLLLLLPSCGGSRPGDSSSSFSASSAGAPATGVPAPGVANSSISS